MNTLWDFVDFLVDIKDDIIDKITDIPINIELDYLERRASRMAGTFDDNIADSHSLSKLKEMLKPEFEKKIEQEIKTETRAFWEFVKEYNDEYPDLKTILLEHDKQLRISMNSILEDCMELHLSVCDHRCSQILDMQNGTEKNKKIQEYIAKAVQSVMPECNKVKQDEIRNAYADIRRYLEELQNLEQAKKEQTESRLQEALVRKQTKDEVVQDLRQDCIPMEEALSCLEALMKEL